ncbi:MAG TPA: hypothetical protein VNH46_04415, partial [Gemmatimonadales bacterium]|nr:hypothetical protein [Gemmatimonadales bacterium]
MRPFTALGLLLATGCAGTFYSRTASPAPGGPDEVYACVQKELKDMGYQRTQYKEDTRWYVARRVDAETQVSSGLYRRTLNVLDTQVDRDDSGKAVLAITAHTYQEFATPRGFD